MQIQHEESQGKGAFYVEEKGERQALLTYHLQGRNTMVIEHTEVDKALQGKNVGRHLVESAVEYARSHQQKIVPVCSFAGSVFDKTPAWHDMLA